MKFEVDAIKYHKKELEELHVVLCDHCEKSLQKSSYDLTISALLEFRNATRTVHSPSSFCIMYLDSIFLKTDILCEQVEQEGAQTLH